MNLNWINLLESHFRIFFGIKKLIADPVFCIFYGNEHRAYWFIGSNNKNLFLDLVPHLHRFFKASLHFIDIVYSSNKTLF